MHLSGAILPVSPAIAVISIVWVNKGAVNLPDLTVGASVPFAEMIASGMAT